MSEDRRAHVEHAARPGRATTSTDPGGSRCGGRSPPGRGRTACHGPSADARRPVREDRAGRDADRGCDAGLARHRQLDRDVGPREAQLEAAVDGARPHAVARRDIRSPRHLHDDGTGPRRDRAERDPVRDPTVVARVVHVPVRREAVVDSRASSASSYWSGP